MGLTFYIVDVIAEEKYVGDQLAVVRGGADSPDERLQKRDLDALRRCKVDWERYTEVAGPGKNLYVFCPEPHENGPGDQTTVHVGGKVQMVARGELV